MTREMRAAHVQSADLELLNIEVTRAGGAVRHLEGERYGLSTSAYHSLVPSGFGPSPHRHPYPEYFVLHQGKGRYLVGARPSTPWQAMWSSCRPMRGTRSSASEEARCA